MVQDTKAKKIFRKFIRKQRKGKQSKLTAVVHKCRSKGLLRQPSQSWNLVTAGELRRVSRGWYMRG